MNSDALTGKMVQAARTVCQTIGSFNGEETDPLTASLVQLLAAVTSSPSLSLDEDDTELVIKHGHAKALTNIPEGLVFHKLFDPSDPNSVTATSLGDCLRDIYDSLKGGLIVIDEQPHKLPTVLWEWRNEFNLHWGRHLVDAIRYLILCKSGASSYNA